MTLRHAKSALPETSSHSGKVLAFNRRSLAYLDRVISPTETVKWAKLAFERLGITRIADQTGLDKIGIPCFAAFRPNAMRLANNQCKGLTTEAAKASAVMEAIEFAIAERPEVPSFVASKRELGAKGAPIVDIKSLLPIGEDIPQDTKLKWIEGYNLVTKQKAIIPLDAVDLSNSRDIPNISKGTNGLASGNTTDEAVFHGLCELIERDGRSLWTLLDKKEQTATAIDPATCQDNEVIGLLKKIEIAGLKIQLFDQTSDIGLPTVMAVIGETDKHTTSHFDLAAGYGTHPNADRAAVRAITEAAQTRVTSIAGSRDDIDTTTYTKEALEEHLHLLTLLPLPNRVMTQGVALGVSLSDLLAKSVFSTMATSYAGDIFIFPLNDPSKDNFVVVKVIALYLEDRDANTNWRPGARALNVMLSS